MNLITRLLSKDAAAADKCRDIIRELGNGFETLVKHFKNIHRYPDADFPKLLELRSLIQELNQQQRGLLFKPHCLYKAITASLKLFDRIDILSPENTLNIMLVAKLTVVWGIFPAGAYTPKNLVKIQKILNRPFPIRWVVGIFSWIDPVIAKFSYRFRREKLFL